MNRRGFTLMELLLVITIIGILSVIATVFIINSGRQARDTRRKADLQAIGLSLQLYYFKYGQYPLPRDQSAGSCAGSGSRSTSALAFVDVNCGGGGQWLTTDANLRPFMVDIPLDPFNQKYYSEDGAFAYSYSSNGKTFDLLAKLENWQSDPFSCMNRGYWIETLGGKSAGKSWCINKTGGTSWSDSQSADWLYVVHPAASN